jgi:hypothetical protein
VSFLSATLSPNVRPAPSPLLARVPIAWVLMWVLFFAPLAGAMHGVAHGVGASAAAAGATHEHQHGVPLKACDECMAMAQVQPAPAAMQLVVAAADTVGARSDAIADGLPAQRPDIFHSRGPPGAA